MKNPQRSLRVFLCHASSDKPAVRQLYERLKKDKVDAWLDEEKLIPGQNWQIEIPKAVRDSDVVIVCLSPQSVNKEGFIQKEIRIALDAADEKPEGTIFIIPARLENCNMPERISQFHWVDLFTSDGYERLIKALTIRAKTLNIELKPIIKKANHAKGTKTLQSQNRTKAEESSEKGATTRNDDIQANSNITNITFKEDQIKMLEKPKKLFENSLDSNTIKFISIGFFSLIFLIMYLITGFMDYAGIIPFDSSEPITLLIDFIVAFPITMIVLRFFRNYSKNKAKK